MIQICKQIPPGKKKFAINIVEHFKIQIHIQSCLRCNLHPAPGHTLVVHVSVLEYPVRGNWLLSLFAGVGECSWVGWRRNQLLQTAGDQGDTAWHVNQHVSTIQGSPTHAECEPGEQDTQPETPLDVNFAPQDTLSLAPVVFRGPKYGARDVLEETCAWPMLSVTGSIGARGQGANEEQLDCLGR